MIVFGIDPGAERMGVVCVEREGKQLIERGAAYFGVTRGGNESKKEEYQLYRLRLIGFWVKQAATLLDSYKPDVVVSEIVPAIGAKSGGSIQLQLAAAALTAFQTVAIQKGYNLRQVGGTTVKARIGGKKSATKVQIRNGVWQIMPDLKKYEAEWKGKDAIFDVCDAFAIALTHLGYRV